MTHFLKYISTFVLAAALLGCQGDSQNETAQQTPQQQSPQLQQSQQPAPDVDLSDEEASAFAKVAIQAQQLQMQSQKKMVGAIQDEGLDVETYQIIAKSTQMGQAPDSISSSEMDKFDSANESIKEIQAEIRKQITKVAEEEGMEMQRFRTISKAARQDTQLQKQIQQKIQQQMSERSRMQQQQQ